MNTATNVRLIVTKAVLWFLVGTAAVLAWFRFTRGLGVTTNLSDGAPWGMWIGFDVLAGVALAAGGFVMAAVVHIFHRHQYHALLRPAILTAFLGYLAVIVGLLFDLGKPWNIWRMTVHWQANSPLFEVGWCVMLYSTVLALEFGPVALEGLRWERAARMLRKAVLPLVIVGIGLSTLHQSSLGTLFLMMPARLHPLWYSPLLPLLFLVSAVGLGLAMVTTESLATSWLYKKPAEWGLLRGLARGAAWVLAFYGALRLGDLAARGDLAAALRADGAALLFWVEMTMSVLAPIWLFVLARRQERSGPLAVGAVLAVMGFVLHRALVGGISHVFVTGQPYAPALTEIAVSLGVVAGMGLIFLFFVERLQVWEQPPAAGDHFAPAAAEPWTGLRAGEPWLGAGARAALALIAGGVTGFALAEAQIAARAQPRPTPAGAPRAVAVWRAALPESPLHLLALADDDGAATAAGWTGAAAAGQAQLGQGLLLGPGEQGYVIFEHELHQQRQGGGASCAVCHHRNLPLAAGTSCARCHRDVHRATDTFAHAGHVAALGGKASCAGCHPDAGAVKTRATAKPCDGCHVPAPAAGTRVRPAAGGVPGVAPGYRAALHDLCIGCHLEHETAVGAAEPYLSRCAACHRPEIAPQAVFPRHAGAAPRTAALAR